MVTATLLWELARKKARTPNPIRWKGNPSVGTGRQARELPIEGTQWLGNTHRAPTTHWRENVPVVDPRRFHLR
jgi:hypothetical protein